MTAVFMVVGVVVSVMWSRPVRYAFAE
jgi:hypothetical protein